MKTIKYFALTFILPAVFAGCRKFVQIPPPTTELVTASVFSNSASATAAQTGIYTAMFNNSESGNMAINLGLLSDELTNYSTSYIPYYANSMTASARPGPWITGYNYIYQANVIIAALQGNKALPAQVMSQLLGEFKFIRAFWLFYLTNLYGDVPLITTTNYSVNAIASRNAQSLVYQQVITDLQSAVGLLNSNYIDATDTTVTTTGRARPNKWAAAALLARVYLYNKQYAQAEAMATAVIGDQPASGRNSNGLYELVPLSSVFLDASQEAIWQLASPGPKFPATYDARLFYLLAAPTICSISPQLKDSFESGDQRAQIWIKTYQTTTTPVLMYYFAAKYSVVKAPDNADCVMVLRLGEQYLVRAEARVYNNNIPGAVNDLNKIRERAGLADYAGAQDAQSLPAAILKERQHELFTEWGHRWLDMIRTKSIDSVMNNPGNVFYYKNKSGVSWSDNDTLFPVPESEILSDPKLTQNKGY